MTKVDEPITREELFALGYDPDAAKEVLDYQRVTAPGASYTVRGIDAIQRETTRRNMYERAVERVHQERARP